jgi:hypothetical protein
MANLFQEGLTDVKGVQDNIYSYYKNSNSLSDISMSDKGTVQQTSKDINGLIQYVESLVTENSKAMSGDNHLGNLTSLIFDAKPQYQSITIQTITSDNVNSPESHYITLADKDPFAEEKYRETFQTRPKPKKMLPRDYMTQLYFASLGVVGLFILYHLMKKSS